MEINKILYTSLLLLISNIFMVFAWYGNLKIKNLSYSSAIFLSWGIAFFEYVFLIPANKIGYTCFSIMQLRTIQEVIGLFVFILFSIIYFGNPVQLNHIVGLLVVMIGVIIIFWGTDTWF